MEAHNLPKYNKDISDKFRQKLGSGLESPFAGSTFIHPHIECMHDPSGEAPLRAVPTLERVYISYGAPVKSHR